MGPSAGSLCVSPVQSGLGPAFPVGAAFSEKALSLDRHYKGPAVEAYSEPPAMTMITPRYKPSDGYAGMAL